MTRQGHVVLDVYLCWSKTHNCDLWVKNETNVSQMLENMLNETIEERS